jgi:hypothetical protein
MEIPIKLAGGVMSMAGKKEIPPFIAYLYNE